MSAAKALEKTTDSRPKVTSILSDSERKQERKNKPRASIAFNLDNPNMSVANKVLSTDRDIITTPDAESDLAIFQEGKSTSHLDLAFTTLAEERKSTAERRVVSST